MPVPCKLMCDLIQRLHFCPTQVWFDNPVSLGAKYMFASSNNLHGVAFWTFDSLDYSSSSSEVSSQTAAMWQALDVFFH